MHSEERVIGLIDMDCFYAQVEQREHPELWGKPVAVVQPSGPDGALGGFVNIWIIALSYEARSFGVKRGMMVPQAKELCKEINICVVPFGEHIDKPDINKYREASAEVFAAINSYDERVVVEKASVDEAFVDLSSLVAEIIASQGRDEIISRYLREMSTLFPTSHIADGADRNIELHDDYTYDREVNLKKWLLEYCSIHDQHLRIAVGAEIVEQIRARVLERARFHCSGGIGVNKMIAKLVCARHKPKQQTLIPHEFAPAILHYTPIADVRFLGGKTGRAVMDRLGVETIGELAKIPMTALESNFPAQAEWLYQLARGYDSELVKPRQLLSSIAVSKQYPGKRALATVAEVRFWLDGLSKELSKRLLADQSQYKRTAENLIVSYYGDSQVSRTVRLNTYNPEVIAEVAWSVLKAMNQAGTSTERWDPPMRVLSVSASRFVEGVSAENRSILSWVLEAGRKRGLVPSQEEMDRADAEFRGLRTSVDSEGWEVFDPKTLEDVLPLIPSDSLDEKPQDEPSTSDKAVPIADVNDIKPSSSERKRIFDKPPDAPVSVSDENQGGREDDDVVCLSGLATSISTDNETKQHCEQNSPSTSVAPTSAEPSEQTDVGELPEHYRADAEAMFDMKKVDQRVFRQLPEFIRAEILHEKHLSDARQLKAQAESKGSKQTETRGRRSATTKPQQGASKKRPATSTNAHPPAKKISDFFKK